MKPIEIETPIILETDGNRILLYTSKSFPLGEAINSLEQERILSSIGTVASLLRQRVNLENISLPLKQAFEIVQRPKHYPFNSDNYHVGISITKEMPPFRRVHLSYLIVSR